MLEVYLKTGTMDKNVIKVNDDKLTDKRSQGLIHHPHESAWRVGQPKWHDHPLIQPFSCLKRHFPLITRPNANLIITTLQIHLCKHCRTTKLIK